MYLIDTDILSYAVRGDPDVLAHFEAAGDRPCFLSAVTLYEIVFGIRRSPRREQLGAALAAARDGFSVLAITEPIAEEAAMIRAELESRGRVIGPIDPLIAATARIHELMLVTHNTKHFQTIGGLAVEDWKE